MVISSICRAAYEHIKNARSLLRLFLPDAIANGELSPCVFLMKLIAKILNRLSVPLRLQNPKMKM